jgi:propanediol dehydratase large subunit
MATNMEAVREKAARIARVMFQGGGLTAATCAEDVADVAGHCNGLGDPSERREFIWSFKLAQRDLTRGL